jgi:hypothetical protein
MYILDIEKKEKESIIRGEIDQTGLLPTHWRSSGVLRSVSNYDQHKCLKYSWSNRKRYLNSDDIDVNERDKNNKPVFDIGRLLLQ